LRRLNKPFITGNHISTNLQKKVQKTLKMDTGPQPPSVNEQLASLESLPLFMNSLPEDAADNPALNALQSLVHDGTPDGLWTCPFLRNAFGCAHTRSSGIQIEVAQNFKEQGNDYFRGKRYREALGFYTQGVDAKPDDARVKEALLLNRAACNLELRTFLPCSSIPPANLFWD
jgi:hypothetical protein